MGYENDKNISETADIIRRKEKRIIEKVRDKICAVRLSGESHAKIAEKLGYSRQFIWAIESGDKEPSLTFIDELIEEYGNI